MKSGFAAAAAARWRTLHETTVVASFIRENGEECARRFLAYDAVELRRVARAYKQSCVKLGYEPMSEEEATLVEREYFSVLEEFGKDFKNPYGWARPFLSNNSSGKKRLRFSDLEAAVDFSSMRFDYGQASNEVHASARSLFAHLGLVEENTLLAGPSIHGMADPGSNTARSLTFLNLTCVQVFPVLDALVSSYVTMLLGDEVRSLLVGIEHKLSSEAECQRPVKTGHVGSNQNRPF
ncbi:MAG: DUF5677 domain-containing protein [Candidatus Latescibacteria bacterium]|nr:DUF5677 domain-containing protein [Candidatus Latescibacterota bacterium]